MMLLFKLEIIQFVKIGVNYFEWIVSNLILRQEI